jgi:Tfp pilus assembly protein PilV
MRKGRIVRLACILRAGSNHFQAGQTLIEAVVVLGTITLIATTITVVITATLSNVQFGNLQSQATKYAQEGMEIMRSIRDSSYTGFQAINGTYCLNGGQMALSPACSTPNINNTFIRTVTVSQNPGCDAQSAQVTVTVSWKDGKCSPGSYCHSSMLISCFVTTNSIPGP